MQAWEKFLKVQESSLGKDVVDSWLRPLKVVKFDACNLFLEAADSFQMMWFEEHIRPKLKHSLFNHNHAPIKVHLSVGDLQLPKPKKSFGKSNEAKQHTFNPVPFQQSLTFDYPDKLSTFDNFIANDANALAHKLLKELCQIGVPENSEKSTIQHGTYNPIYLYGDHGSGKTHLLAATVHALMKQGYRVIYARSQTFTEHVVSAIRAGEMHLFRQAYRNTDVLIIDDVQEFGRKSATQEEFFHTFNTLHMAGKQIILAGNRTPSELQHIEPRLISRFEWGIVLELKALVRQELSDLLSNKCSVMQFPLNPRTAEYILETFPSGAKALTKALEALVLRSHIAPGMHSHVSSTAISVNQARLYLSDLTKIEIQEQITPEKIIKHVAEHFGIKSEDILGKSQSRECSFPRQLAAFLCRDILKMPFKKIGDLFSRDHSTIMSSVRQIQKQLDENQKDILSAYKSIKTAIKNPLVPTEETANYDSIR
ncbi:MAG: DnaA/Hda family protein [Parachlamydiales bacterium]|jgi:chromosomal replication initiator protein